LVEGKFLENVGGGGGGGGGGTEDNEFIWSLWLVASGEGFAEKTFGELAPQALPKIVSLPKDIYERKYRKLYRNKANK